MKFMDADGTIKVLHQQGRPQKPRNVTEKNRKKQICLKCTKPKCRGTCKRIREGD